MEKSSNEMSINEKEQKKQQRILSGKRLKLICDSIGLKQINVAEITETYPQTINDIFKGKRPLPRIKAIKLCDYLKEKYDITCSIEWLLGYDVAWNNYAKECNNFESKFYIEQLSNIMEGYSINYEPEKELYEIKDNFGYKIWASKLQIDFFLHNIMSVNRILSRQFFASISNSACALYSDQEDKTSALLLQNGITTGYELQNKNSILNILNKKFE